ncbi:MAG: hypothetical protein IKG65_08040 [Exiguobacterium sp.]|nr:hypothetical protein [Exiguobacterium sp.]
MQKEQVKAFKNELRNYTFYCSRIVSLGNSIEFCYDRLGGVRGIDPSKEPVHAMPNKEMEYKLRDEIERYEATLKRYKEKVDSIDEILERIELPIREAVITVYVNGNQLVKVARDYYLSPTGLQKRINRAIEKAIPL